MTMFQRMAAFDAAGRHYDPAGVVWSSADIMGMFADARDRGDFCGGQIAGYRQDEPGTSIRAIVWYKEIQSFSVHEMDVDTGKPRQVAGVRVKRRKPRPRMSRDFKIWRATRRWEER